MFSISHSVNIEEYTSASDKLGHAANLPRPAAADSGGTAAQTHHVGADVPIFPIALHSSAEISCPGALLLVLEESHHKVLHSVAALALLGLALVRVHRVVVLAEELPILASNHPDFTIPAIENAQSVEVPSDSPVLAPCPACWFVVVVALPEMPISSNFLVTSLHVAVQGSATVKMMTNALVLAPAPLSSAMVAMIVPVAAVELPKLTDHNPATSVITFEDAQTVKVTANAFGTAIEPATSFVEVVALEHGPVRAHVSPVSVPEAAQDASSVKVETNAPVLAPEPLVLSM